jgi:iron-sulfur cluster repair protein YtfE (RIC family)
MASEPPPSQPIDILRWEHTRLDQQLDELVHIASHHFNSNADEFHDRLNLTLRFLESHQETEERFLFPLVLKLEEDLFLSLKKEHQAIFHRSDIVVSSTSLIDSENLSTLLSNLRSNLNDHFFEEETSVFAEAEKSLSVSQMDILRIKFATRHPVVV